MLNSGDSKAKGHLGVLILCNYHLNANSVKYLTLIYILEFPLTAFSILILLLGTFPFLK